jgi:hypothetical protein
MRKKKIGQSHTQHYNKRGCYDKYHENHHVAFEQHLMHWLKGSMANPHDELNNTMKAII